MKTFTRHKGYKQIRKDCIVADFEFRDKFYQQGSDHVSFNFVFENVTVYAIYNTINGRCFGKYENKLNGRGGSFTTDNEKHDRFRWFKALLNFIYIP